MKPCDMCELHASAKHPCVWGKGPVPCRLMLVGEAPGFHEDIKQEPFVGEAGRLLTFVLEKLSISRDQVYITNVLKCRPPNNELPSGSRLKECIKACSKHLIEEVRLVRPKAIVYLGATAIFSVLGKTVPVTGIEGLKIGKNLWAAVHPAFVLRSPSFEANLGRTLAVAARFAGLRVIPKGEEHGRFPYEVRGV